MAETETIQGKFVMPLNYAVMAYVIMCAAPALPRQISRESVDNTNSKPGESSKITIDIRKNHPNPFGGSLGIKFRLPADGGVLVKIFNIKAEPIAESGDCRLDAGEYLLNISLANHPSGIYLVQINTREKTETGMFRRPF